MIKVVLLVSACMSSSPHHCASPEQRWPWWQTANDCWRDTPALIADLRRQGFNHVTMRECIKIDEALP